jgi:hypothetical protein
LQSAVTVQLIEETVDGEHIAKRNLSVLGYAEVLPCEQVLNCFGLVRGYVAA